jgi:hypothetical protein
MIKKFISFKNLNRIEKKIFLEATFYFYLIWYKLLVCSKFSLVKQVLETTSVRNKGDGPRYPHLGKFIKLFNAAACAFPLTTCLSIALAGKILFNKYGYNVKLHVGVLKNSSKMLEAHAWLSFEGDVIHGSLSGLHNYVELPIEKSAWL